MANGILLSWLATDHDPFYSREKRGAFLEPAEGLLEGPSLSLVTDPSWGPRLTRYFVFCQKGCGEQARALRRAIDCRRAELDMPPLAVEVKEVEDFPPTNHGLILKHLSPKIREILSAYPYKPETFARGSPLWQYASERHHEFRGWGHDWASVAMQAAVSAPPEVLEEDGRWHEANQHQYFVCISQGTPSMHAIWLILVQAEILRATVVQTVPPQFRAPGESSAREVALDLGKLPMPVMQDIKRSGIREHDTLRKMGGVAVLSHFMAANTYRGDQSYGLYRLTHSPTSPALIEESLGRVGRDLDDVREWLSEEALALIEQFIGQAKAAFSSGWEPFLEWSPAGREKLKAHLRFSFREWAEGLPRSFPGLQFEFQWEGDADIFPELYCEAAVVRRGLNAIVENVAKHEYPDQGDRPLAVRIARTDGRLEVRIEDRGVGFPRLAERFQKRAGSTGGGLTDIKRLAKWFQVRIDSTCRVSYDLGTSEERLLRGPHTGTVYVLTCRLPPTLESRASERVQ